MPQPEEIWNVKRLLEWTTDYLKKNRSDSPRLDAEILLAHVLKWKRIELYTQFGYVPNDTRKAEFRDFVKRRANGEPVAYLVGTKEFYSLPFIVTPDVLIPRPETEHLVVESLDLLAKSRKTEELHVCDVGTGSGAVAVAIAKHALKCRITAIDISEKALHVARLNAKKHAVDERMTFIAGDLLESFTPSPQFDLIVSNPPYVSEGEYTKLPPDVKNFEPKTALVAGNDGMEVILRLIEQAASRLDQNGSILVELSPMISRNIAEFFKKSPQIWSDIRILSDFSGLERIVSAGKS
ncbi:MAG: peptide chain release factor N(5)-glutamine methyltransferase [Planctomycetaceae bacterium]|nr:peptide chain release factor N(5)-glutamine methyltransferase [Planctomycetaceae bacterium]